MGVTPRDYVRPDGDSALSFTANIIGILTFLYAVAAGLWYLAVVYRGRPEVMFDLLQDHEDTFGEALTLIHRFGKSPQWGEPGESLNGLNERALQDAFRIMFTRSNEAAMTIGKLASSMYIDNVRASAWGGGAVRYVDIETSKLDIHHVRMVFDKIYQCSHGALERYKFWKIEGDLRAALRRMKISIANFKRVTSDFIPDVNASDYEIGFQRDVMEELRKMIPTFPGQATSEYVV